ncbi:hypothetical protein KFU94_19275 [Chloroflexi bacterium TSY]|nr:hypothetical protein [Chloroflexi bacterium TSY]
MDLLSLVSGLHFPRELTFTAKHQVLNAFVTSLAFSPDGKSMLSGSSDGTIALWDVQTFTEIDRLITDVSFAPVEDIAISADSRLLASASRFGEPYLWNRDTNVPERLELSRGGKTIAALARIAFRPGSSLLVGGSTSDGSIVLWDTETKSQIGDPILGHPDSTVTDIEISPDGRWLVSSDSN